MKQLFPYDKPVRGKDLIDRKEEIKRIVSEVKGEQSIILTSPRRYGKTSIIHECLRILKNQNMLVGYIDLFEKSSIRELAEGIVESTLQNEISNARKILSSIKTNLAQFIKLVRFKHIWEEHEFILSFGSSEIDENTLLNEALDFPEKFSLKRKMKMVFAIDEFGDLKDWDSKLLKKMRAKFQRHIHTTYIFSGSQESVMKDLFTNRSYAFYGFGKMMEIGPLPREDLSRYLLKTFRKAKISAAPKTADAICELTDNHPHYTKILAQATLEQLEGKKKIDLKDVQEGYKRAFFQVKGEIDKEWENLSRAPLQKRVLKFIAKEKKGLYAKGSFPSKDKQQLYFALTELQKKGIIQQKDKGEYSFSNPFFMEYILMMD